MMIDDDAGSLESKTRSTGMSRIEGIDGQRCTVQLGCNVQTTMQVSKRLLSWPLHTTCRKNENSFEMANAKRMLCITGISTSECLTKEHVTKDTGQENECIKGCQDSHFGRRRQRRQRLRTRKSLRLLPFQNSAAHRSFKGRFLCKKAIGVSAAADGVVVERHSVPPCSHSSSSSWFRKLVTSVDPPNSTECATPQ